MRKIFTLFASIILATSAWATVINGIDYTLNDGSLTATVSNASTNKSYSGSNLVIPATVSYNSKTYTVNKIDTYAFDGNTHITSVTLPGTITSSDNGSYVFRNCTSLTHVAIEEGFSGSVLRWFNGCSALTTIFIPSSMKFDTQYTFVGCTHLQDVYVHWASLNGDEVLNYTFGDLTLSNIRLHVPAGTESLYAATSPWSSFNIVPEARALGGAFTVSSGKQVHFSKGNLQYKAITSSWRFAENQYDYIGAANANISASYSGWIDMFGWSTANSPTTWEDNVSQYPTSFADWGTKSIVNGCNAPNKWRTLTSAEWNYIINSRSTSSGIRYAKATVNGVTGLILLPDNWSTSYYTLNSTNTQNVAYSVNTISLSNWTSKLEAHGAVFLPAAGFRYGTECQHIGVDCVYWSSTPESGDDIYDMYVYADQVGLQYHRRSLGCSVRLVCDKYTVTYNANGGSAAPSAQIKYTGDNVTLSNATLTRTGLVHTGWNTNANGTGTHYAKGATYSANANLTLYAEWAFQGSGTSSDPYLIPSLDAWNFLADKVEAGTNYSGKYFRQTADISGVTQPIGNFVDDQPANQKPFSGTYNGDGHTLNVNIHGSANFTGPFYCLSNATIKNLVVTGSVTSSYRHASGLVGTLMGPCTLENCLVSTNVSGTDFMGGLIGHSRLDNFTIVGCVFNGTLTATGDGYTGGFNGWGGEPQTTNATITNSFFAGTYINSSGGKFHPVGCFGGANATRTISNVYYTAARVNMTDEDGLSIVKDPVTDKGDRVYSVTAGTGVTMEIIGTPTISYNVSKLDLYGENGIAFDGVRYGGQGDAVSLNLTYAAAPVGHSFSHYSVDHGNLTGSSNPHTLTMANANAVISANYSVNQYTISFNSNGGTDVAAITQDYNTAVTAPSAPAKTGYTFAGWSPVVPATMPAENMELTAQWTINQYTITFNSNGGSDVAAITQDYNTAVTAPAAPSKTGYTFAGWDPAVPATMPAENVELTAQWNVDTSISLNDADGIVKTILAALNDGNARNITISRSLSRDGNYSTLCLPFDLDAAHIASSSLNGFVICELTDMWSVGNELRLLMTQTSSIEAGKPYLVRYAQEPTTAVNPLEFYGVTVSASVGGSTSAEGAKMYGILEPTHLEVDNHNILFLMANNTITWPNSDNPMNAFRAYFDVTPTPKTSTFYRGMPTRIVEQCETPTGIEEVTGDGLPVTGVQKIIRDGQLVIIRNGVEYNANGQILK